MGRSAHLIIDKEAYIVVTEKLNSAYGLAKNPTGLAN